MICYIHLHTIKKKDTFNSHRVKPSYAARTMNDVTIEAMYGKWFF